MIEDRPLMTLHQLLRGESSWWSNQTQLFDTNLRYNQDGTQRILPKFMATRDTYSLRDDGEAAVIGKIIKGRLPRIPLPQIKLKCLG